MNVSLQPTRKHLPFIADSLTVLLLYSRKGYMFLLASLTVLTLHPLMVYETLS